ncbi:SubName: Full=Uncharacterized protein {ECO:0000313/EMBL:CCA71078.1} [Serendipita indica DSM 11827]|uniref:PEBP-like protein n=1 Tax=Serendipita indica (strain DSM 11827) TaxID=1109443 RepID=G4TIC9_SERID|nr:SubName: Full=Uncharacterized protein {ECO:0000313/EMBL:CCA71078.1} [Serendipita indica DSM 11827]CCA71078.1 hypothetical protein PIIN_05013 [Serendipita indica DSM 11827]
MLTTSLLTILSAFALVRAQNTTNNPQLEVQSIDAQFDNSYLVPDLLASFDPLAFLTVSYGGQPISAGTLLPVNDTQAVPTITITPANSSVSLGDLFTLAMVDPGAIGKLSTPGPTRHWLVNGVTIGANGVLSVPQTAITAYGAPYPDEADAPHRYAILLWQQPASFAPQGDLANPGQPITQFDLNSYVSSSGLGPVVAGWYFTCTRGDAVAPTITSAVDIRTLPAYAAGTASGSSHSASGTHTSTGSPNGALSSISFKPVTALAGVAAAIFSVAFF